MNRILLIPLVLLFVLSLLFIIGTSTARAVNYTITINDTNLNKNQDIVFNETNIGPGFSKSYNIHVNNQSSDSVMFGIHDSQEDAMNSLTLSELNLIFKHGDVVLLNFRDNVINGGFSCIGPGTDDLFTFNLSLDSSFGNEYQNRSFLIDITFRADASECEYGNGKIDPQQPPSPPQLPNTGESRGIYYFLLGGIVIFSLTTITLLIIFMLTRKRKREDKKYEKNSV